MSTAILNIEVKADGVTAAEKKLDDMTSASMRAEKQVDGLTRSTSALVSTLSAMGVAVGALGLIKMADNWSDLNSRVRLASGGIDEGAAVMERLGEMARRTYSDVNLTTESYLNNSTALRELGYTTKETLDFTEALNNAFVVSGAKAQRAESVMNALGKAMASGKLSGQELNTVIQTGGRVAELLAKELGTTVAGLRDLGAKGDITGKVIYNTMTKNLELLRNEAESMPATISDAFTLIRNSVLQNVGVFDQAGKVSETFASGLITVADNMDTVTKAAAALAALGTAKYLSGLVASSQAYVAQQYMEIAAAREAIVVKNASAVEELNLAAARVKNAEASMATHRANGLVTASYAALSRELLASRIALSAATATASATATAMNGLTASATASSLAVRGLSSALSFVGGPVGLAVLGVGAGFYLLSQRAQEAENRAARYAEAIKQAGENSELAAGGIQNAAEKLFKLAEGATAAENAVALSKAINDQKAAIDELSRVAFVATRSYIGFQGANREVGASLMALTKQFNTGKISAETYIREVDKMSKLNPSLAKPISEVQALARVVAAATGVVAGFNAAVANLGGGSGKGGRLNQNNIMAARMEVAEAQFKQMLDFEKRYGDIQEKLKSGGFGKPEKESKGGGSGGGGGGGKSAAESIADDMKYRLEALKTGLQSEMEAKIAAYAEDMETLKWYLDNKKMTEEEYEIFKDQLQEKAFERGLTEEERLTAEYERQLQMLQQYLEQKKISEEDYNKWREEATAAHEEKIRELRFMAYADALGGIGDLMGAMANVVGSNNEKMLKAQRIFGAASALVSTYIGAAKALELGFPQNLAAMATVLAKGMSLVAAIKSGSKSSASGGGAGGTTQAAAPQEKAPLRQMAQITLHGGEMHSTESVAKLMGKMNEMMKDGYVLDVKVT